MSTDSAIPEFTAGWEFVGLRDTTVFFRNVDTLLGPDSALVLEESSMARDVRSFVEAHSAKPLGRIRPGTLWPRSRCHWLPASSEVLDGLTRLSERHAEPEMCDHLYAVSDGCLIVAWHDAFDGPLVVSSGVSEDRIRNFSRAVGISLSQWQRQGVSQSNMSHEEKRRAREIQEQIRQVLLLDWDPIGVQEIPEAQDEYDSYVGGVYRLLVSHAQDEELVEHLYRIERKTMGLGPRDKSGLLPVVQKLRTLNVANRPLRETTTMTKLGQIARNVGAALIAVPIVILAVPLALVSGLVTTLTGERKRHDQAWEPMRGYDPEGLTAFQVLCERKLLEAANTADFSLADRQVHLTTIRFVEWKIEGTPLSIGIYPDGAGIWGDRVDDRFEEWDARTPDELIEVFSERVVRRATEFRQAV